MITLKKIYVLGVAFFMSGIIGCGNATETQAVPLTSVEEESTTAVEIIPEMTGVVVSANPTQNVYMVGETLDTEGLVLEALFDDGSTEVIEDGFSCSPTELTQVGKQEITVSYEGKDTTFTVDVLEPFVFENIDIVCTSVSNGVSGYNVSGEPVNWALNIEFDLSEEMRNLFTPTVTSTWAHVTNGEGYWEKEGTYEDAKNGETYSEFGIVPAEHSYTGKQRFMHLVFLPDNSAIAGEQSVTLQVGTVKKTISFTLTYMGDYENGTGWNIHNIRY